MAGLKIGRMVLGICQTNCYFVYREGSREVICFDPADAGDHIYETLKGKGLEVAGILLTGGNPDGRAGMDEICKHRKCSGLLKLQEPSGFGRVLWGRYPYHGGG